MMIDSKLITLVLVIAFIPHISCFNISCRCQHDEDKNLIALAVTAPNDLLTDLLHIEKNINRVCNAACLKYKIDKQIGGPATTNGDAEKHIYKVGKFSVYRSKRNVNEEKMEDDDSQNFKRYCNKNKLMSSKENFDFINWICSMKI